MPPRKTFTRVSRLTAMDTDVRSALGLIRKVKSSVSSQLCANRPPQGGRPAQGWKAWFSIRLAGFWHIITGEQPSTSPDGPFAELVSAAWNSLHPNIPEVKWGTFVRRFARSGSLDEALFTAFIAGRFAHRIGYAESRAVTNLAGGKLGLYPTGTTGLVYDRLAMRYCALDGGGRLLQSQSPDKARITDHASWPQHLRPVQLRTTSGSQRRFWISPA